MENKEILSVQDLMALEVEEDNYMFEETSLCTICSWTSGPTTLMQE
ncbi:hypothetical protein QP794_23155 [Paenibacillus sp. UMB7766-LJ446]|nr:hypothetical protein [Paenibacillus sp. UMB7766-LJ446]MDK8192991.1 hypothetical protein [Paenibacillus sp. UMB7766-LJ446]